MGGEAGDFTPFGGSRPPDRLPELPLSASVPLCPKLKPEWAWRAAVRLPDTATTRPEEGLVAMPGLSVANDPRYHANPDACIPDFFLVQLQADGGGAIFGCSGGNNDGAIRSVWMLQGPGLCQVVVPRTTMIRALGTGANTTLTVGIWPTDKPVQMRSVWRTEVSASGPLAMPPQGALSSTLISSAAGSTLAIDGTYTPIAIPDASAGDRPEDLGPVPGGEAWVVTLAGAGSVRATFEVVVPG